MRLPYTIRYREDGPGAPRVYPVAIERHGRAVLHLVPSERTMEHAEELVALLNRAEEMAAECIR